ncbi:MAG: tRNA pseudouridine(13) synthase TruD [Candidatus Nitrosopelagicus sp.]|nr:tRNA pseudouridine(13) synthase TruD [Candidatus Nitrosopelagicus sp.]
MIPQIDKEIGISVYTTNFSSISGKIKQNENDFLVREVLSEKSIDSFDNLEGHAVYLLKKSGIDTNHALIDIEKRYGLVLKSLGLKDAHAQTEQYVYTYKKTNSLEEYSGKKYSAQRLGFVQKPISKKDMLGNSFEIQISDLTESLPSFTNDEKILNFFGYQRFGSKRPITHLVGKSIVKGDYEEALEYLLNFSSKYDSEKNNELRKLISERKSESEVIESLPYSMDIERNLLKQLSNDSNPKNAIRSIPLALRRFYIQAYQSFLFNKTLSLAYEFEEELFLPIDDDVCFDKNSILGKFQNDSTQKLAIPLVGHSYYKKSRFDYYIKKILDEELLIPKDFFIKDFQEISVDGGFRNTSINYLNFEMDENMIKFQLSRGSYATIVLREILKPLNPLDCGF